MERQTYLNNQIARFADKSGLFAYQFILSQAKGTHLIFSN
jgi:hypothetical protein